MCGIVGMIRFAGAAPVEQREAEIERMTRSIAHRGPDGQGVLVRDNVAIGHRRLSIIDIDTGQQPMCNEDGTVWVTFNGEIYNFKSLRDELIRAGHVFKSHCDTEVIVHGYEQWGTGCVEKFRGMFAFGIFDFRNRTGMLARDHFGIKPLCYHRGAGHLSFASELSALRASDTPPNDGNLRAIEQFLRYQYIPTPQTIYHDVFKLPPAHYLTFDFDGRISAATRYWDFQFKPGPRCSDEEWVERFDQTIAESVAAHLVCDVPFGVFLSGGIDSTLVAMQMSRILQRPVEGFCIGFDEQKYSEIRFAEEVARKIGFPLHTEVVRPDVMREILPDLLAHYGEPFGDSSAIPTWYVSRLARKHVPMVLSGDGGDEAFGGYATYESWMPVQRRQLALRAIRGSRSSARLLARELRRRPSDRTRYGLKDWQRLVTYVPEDRRRALWKPELGPLVDEVSDLFEESNERAERFDRLAYAQYVDFQTYLPGAILTKVDIASMYHGLEVRTPLIDLRVLELASQLPSRLRMRRSVRHPPIMKFLPKKSLERTFAKEFIHRPKQGFAIPRDEWFISGEKGRPFLNSVLTDRGSRLSEFFDMNAVMVEMLTHQRGRDNSPTLWLIMVLGHWLAQHPHVAFR